MSLCLQIPKIKTTNIDLALRAYFILVDENKYAKGRL